MTKKLFTLCFILAIAISATAQTKEETIAWLKEKLEISLEGTYTARQNDFGPIDKLKNVKLESIDECELTISYTREQRSYKITFPTNIQSIKNITANTFLDEIECWSFSYDAEVVKVENKTDDTSYYRDNGWGISISQREENLRSRIEKALKHLATFCPKKKETF